MSERPHTTTPWDCVEDPRGRLVHVETAANHPIAAGLPICSIPRKRAGDAEFIVRAANCHDELVAALGRCLCILAFEAERAMSEQDAVAAMQNADAMTKARAALAKARGETP